MTDDTLATAAIRLSSPLRFGASTVLPVMAVGMVLLVIWYLAAIALNGPRVTEALNRGGQPYDNATFIAATWAMERPVLPAPHQIALELWNTTIDKPVDSKRSLVFHGAVTLSAALAGFVLGTVLGIVLAIGIVHVTTLDRSLMPWIVASQTVPILAIAPMIVVVLGNIGLTGLVPKAIISAYLSFFPVALGMVKGLRAPDPLQLDLMRTYSATRTQTFNKLRWPAAMSFLFPGLKVAVALSLVGAIIAELPTGAQSGLGSRLLSGSYYGQTVQIWAALVMAAILAVTAIGVLSLIERGVVMARGGRL
ncbi:MAG: ABC transporter permease [Azospirillaceae bacterium]|nr:ABC transporter permease [Azospirillaceae bacterium]